LLPFGRVQQQYRRALRHLVADFHTQLLHHARPRRRNLHGGLVRLERDERLLLGDRVTWLDQHLDDFDVLEVPDVGDLHFVAGH